MRVSEYGDEFVRIDFSFDRGERGMETFTGERGAHLNVSGSQKSASKRQTELGQWITHPARDRHHRALVQARIFVALNQGVTTERKMAMR
jgi:hypothetical protein